MGIFLERVWHKVVRGFMYAVFDCTPLQGYLMHIPHGVVNVFMAVFVCWTIALLFGAGFVYFQYNQEKSGHKPAHYDLAGWLLGLVIGGVLYLVFF